MKKITSYLLFFLVLVSLFAGMPFSFFGNNIAIAPANSTNTLGYEFLDSDAVVRIWNNFDSYYFNVSNGIQFTNHYQEYWTHNVMMLGYYAGSTWNLLYRTDELSGFEKTIDLTETYCNATLWKDLTYAGYNFRLAIRYCLGVNDNNLTVIPYIKNLGIDIPYQIAFGWEMKDIQVDGNIENDYIKINDTQYFLDQPLDNTYTGLSDSRFYLVDDTHSSLGGKVLYLDWDSSLDYLVTVKSRSGQYNAPVTLFIKAGTLASGQEKYTKMYWWDSAEDLTTFTEHDAINYFSQTTTTNTWTDVPSTADNHTVYKDYGAGYFYGNMNFNFEFKMTSSTPGQNFIGIWMISNKLDDLNGQIGVDHYDLLLYRNNPAPALNLYLENKTAAHDISIDLSINTLYYLTVSLNITKVICKIYSDFARVTLLDTISINRTAATFRYLFCGASYHIVGAGTSTGFVRLFNISRNFNITTLPANNIKATSSNLRGQIDTWNKTGRMWFKYGLTLAYGTYTTYQYAPVNASTVYNQSIIGLTPGKLYHYRAIGNNNTKTINGSDAMFLTKPEAPTNIHYTTINSTAINITWTKGTGANRTVILKKTGSVPTTPTDGTVIYNNTGTYYRYTTATNVFIQMWGFDKWINGSTTLYQFSDNSSIYSVFVNCYNESSGIKIANYSVFFTNPEGTWTYAHDNCNNTFAISVNDIPQGDDISLLVNATGYYARTYVMDIVITGNYYINVYLVPITATLYYLRVVETIETSYAQVDQAVEGASVIIKRYINASAGYQTISSLVTDANGYVNLQLVPYVQYKVFISKTGYDDKISDYIPAPPNEWGQTVEKVFRIVLTAVNVTPPPSYQWSDYITFTGILNNTTKIITTTYNDALTNTTNWQLYVYRMDPNSTTLTLVSSFSGTNDSFTLTANVTDTTSSYVVVFYVNHTNFGYHVLELYFYGYPPGITTASRFNLLFTLNYGYNPFGWANTFMFFVILGCLFSFDRKNTYMAIFLIGFILLFINIWIGIETIWTALAAGFFPILMIFFGILMLIRDRGYSGVS